MEEPVTAKTGDPVLSLVRDSTSAPGFARLWSIHYYQEFAITAPDELDAPPKAIAPPSVHL